MEQTISKYGQNFECDDDTNEKDILYFVRNLKFAENEFKIRQRCVGNVSCVVWDSAIVACHYFVRLQPFWKRKKVLELGAGTGVCSILLAALGADVIATDLSEGIKLLEQNIIENWEAITKNEGSVRAEILDWNDSCDKLPTFDVLIMIDIIYYLRALEGLVRIMLRLKATTIICCYEVRDIGEPKIAQAKFFHMISPFFNICPVADKELDDVYKSPDIKVLRLVRK